MCNSQTEVQNHNIIAYVKVPETWLPAHLWEILKKP
jgi:hypothetical protein